ncbi:MAG: hypothetical protein HC903_32300 [Methylacidiphilales bacterium]|nr:hypothetical protein [Candidatus Methylacidiphilales bacterium]NJR19603.1 hypothetical protein [Calothrix sp. CSU_2_0]
MSSDIALPQHNQKAITSLSCANALPQHHKGDRISHQTTKTRSLKLQNY